jgi:hypothetical protein
MCKWENVQMKYTSARKYIQNSKMLARQIRQLAVKAGENGRQIS